MGLGYSSIGLYIYWFRIKIFHVFNPLFSFKAFSTYMDIIGHNITKTNGEERNTWEIERFPHRQAMIYAFFVIKVMNDASANDDIYDNHKNGYQYG